MKGVHVWPNLEHTKVPESHEKIRMRKSRELPFLNSGSRWGANMLSCQRVTFNPSLKGSKCLEQCCFSVFTLLNKSHEEVVDRRLFSRVRRCLFFPVRLPQLADSFQFNVTNFKPSVFSLCIDKSLPDHANLLTQSVTDNYLKKDSSIFFFNCASLWIRVIICTFF